MEGHEEDESHNNKKAVQEQEDEAMVSSSQVFIDLEVEEEEGGVSWGVTGKRGRKVIINNNTSKIHHHHQYSIEGHEEDESHNIKKALQEQQEKDEAIVVDDLIEDGLKSWVVTRKRGREAINNNTSKIHQEKKLKSNNFVNAECNSDEDFEATSTPTAGIEEGVRLSTRLMNSSVKSPDQETAKGIADHTIGDHKYYYKCTTCGESFSRYYSALGGYKSKYFKNIVDSRNAIKDAAATGHQEEGNYHINTMARSGHEVGSIDETSRNRRIISEKSTVLNVELESPKEAIMKLKK